jgi:cytidylate kinase
MPIRITVTGDLGSGKSTVCRLLENKYGLDYYSTGAIQRKIAGEMGISTFELIKYSEDHPEIDRMIDDGIVALSLTTKDVVVDSRMAWHFLENSYRVFLTADPHVAAHRVSGDNRGSTETYGGISEAVKQLSARKKSENYRYSIKYNVDCSDLRNFDLVLDTTSITPEETAEIIMLQYGALAQTGVQPGGEGQPIERPLFLISRFCLYPTRSIREISNDIVENYKGKINGGKTSGDKIIGNQDIDSASILSPIGNQDIDPVSILSSNGIFYIFDGHHRAIAYIQSGIKVIPCSLAGQDNDAMAGQGNDAIAGRGNDDAAGSILSQQYISDEFSLAKAHDWENSLGFKYFTYPLQGSAD